MEDKKVTFLDAVNGLEAARKFMFKFEIKDSVSVVCNKAENELYRQRTQGRKETNDNYSLVKEINKYCKGNAIPLHAWTGPEGSRRLRLPDCKTVAT